MSELYTWKDIIFCKEQMDEMGLKVGDEVYYGDSLNSVLMDANRDEPPSRLNDVDGGYKPFDVESMSWAFVIKKKSKKKKWVPFDFSKAEVRDSLRGKWVRNDTHEFLIDSFSVYDKYGWMIRGVTTPEELLEHFEFFDGSPCGVEVEE